MPILYTNKCKTCKLSKIDKQLKRRIYQSAYFSEYGTETLTSIHRDYKSAITYKSLLIHCQRHIVLKEGELKRLQAKYGQVDIPEKKPAVPISGGELRKVVKQQREDEVFDSVIDAGMEKLKAGELKITTDHLIRAADSKANLSLRRKDQELKIQEMIWHFASGEAEGNKAYDQRIIEGETATTYDATAITAKNISRRQEWPRPIHKRTTRHAPALRAS